MKNLKRFKEGKTKRDCRLFTVNTALEIKSKQEPLRHQRVSSEAGIAQRKGGGGSKK